MRARPTSRIRTEITVRLRWRRRCTARAWIRAASTAPDGRRGYDMSVLARRAGVPAAVVVGPRVGGTPVQAQGLLLHHRSRPAPAGAELVPVAELVPGLVVDHVGTVRVQGRTVTRH